MPRINLLSGGYWLVRWNDNQWIQWPKNRLPTLEDCFGEMTEKHVAIAARLAALEQEK